MVGFSRRTLTAVVQPKDAAFIVQQLQTFPGAVVVESGTGSGVLTSFFAAAVAPRGHVHTFEYNEKRADAARAEFARTGLSECVTARHADVYESGFGEEMRGRADAAFLDLPAPWKALRHADTALRPCGRLASYSPCVEQVQRTVSELRAMGYLEVRTFELVERTYQAHRRPLPKSAFEELGNKLQGALSTHKSLAAFRRSHDSAPAPAPAPAEAASGERTTAGGVSAETVAAGAAEDAATEKPRAEDDGTAAPAAKRARSAGTRKTEDGPVTSLTRPTVLMRGHTSYLTFAIKPGKAVEASVALPGAAPERGDRVDAGAGRKEERKDEK